MGVKYEGGDVFDAVMKPLLADAWVRSDTVQAVASGLVKSLLDLHWDNADATLGEYDENDAIVAAFKEHGILLPCQAEHPDDGESCEEPGRDHSTPHRDYLGRTWSTEGGGE